MRPFRPASLRLVARPRHLRFPHLSREKSIRRSLTTYSNTPEGGHTGPSAQPVHIQRRLWSSRRWSVYALHGVFAYMVWSWLMGGDAEEEELLDEEDDDEPLFIAFQYPRILAERYWKADDPGWQEHCKLGREPERLNDVQYELAMKAGKIALMTLSSGSTQFGLPARVTRMWIDRITPDFDARQYSRKGLEITNDAIYWKDDVISSSEYKHLEKMLLPRAVYTAIRDGTALFVRLQVLKVKKALGLSLSDHEQGLDNLARMASNCNEEYAQLQNDIKTLDPIVLMLESDFRTKKLQEGHNDIEIADLERRAAVARATLHKKKVRARRVKYFMDARNMFLRPESEETEDKGEVQRSGKSGALGVVLDHLPRLPKFEVPADIVLLRVSMMSSLVSNWSAWSKDDGTFPEGCCIMEGDIEICGGNLQARVAVKAFYHPKDRKFHEIKVRVKWIREQAQAPKGSIIGGERAALEAKSRTPGGAEQETKDKDKDKDTEASSQGDSKAS